MLKPKVSRVIPNLPTGEVSLFCSVKFLGIMYLLGQSLWFLALGLNSWVWFLGLFISLGWGVQIRAFRLRLNQYPVIGLRYGRWFLVDQQASEAFHHQNNRKEIQVCLDFDSVILPGMLLLNFKDKLNKKYRFLIVPGMVLGNENFSWLSRYAKLSPVFQSRFI